jgi:hypothetical protein
MHFFYPVDIGIALVINNHIKKREWLIQGDLRLGR